MTFKEDVFRPQSEFPLIKEYQKVFKIDDRTIFAYDNKIYSNYDLTPDLIVHEYTHWKQQAEIGLDKWVELYLKSPEFRLEMELEAYKRQLESIKDRNTRDKVRIFSAQALSSELYGNLLSTKDAMFLLKT